MPVIFSQREKMIIDKSIEILKNVSRLRSEYDCNDILAPSENMDELVKLLTSGSLVTE